MQVQGQDELGLGICSMYVQGFFSAAGVSSKKPEQRNWSLHKLNTILNCN